MIYLINISTKLSSGVGDPMVIPSLQEIQVADATEMVKKSEILISSHREEVRKFLEIKEGWYILSANVDIKMIGFGIIDPKIEIEESN
ncbi:MAG TPA: hypothetical protein DEP38_10235 [Cyanobacteria bacterium UBA9226]|nr:hypothetical protein [Cyanobacteria bacterium UBA11153]HCA95020.1 hypothetical protein [Cyanobacteria bacterium UBA9226]